MENGSSQGKGPLKSSVSTPIRQDFYNRNLNHRLQGLTLTMDVVEKEITDYIRKSCGGNPVPADSLASVGIDSVGMAELTFELEQRFKIRVDEDVFDVQTISELAQYVRDRRKPERL